MSSKKKENRDLLFLYSESARAKRRDMAGLLKKSPQRINYSLKALEKQGILKDPYCIFDYSYFGLILFRIYFKGGYVSEKDKDKIIKKLSGHDYIVAIYELSGEFDLAIEILSPNPSRFNKELRSVVNEIPTLNNYKIIHNIVTHIYPRSYLIKNPNVLANIQPEIIIGGDREVQTFTKNEMQIMEKLLKNPRTRLTKLAKQSYLNIKTAGTVLKHLKQGKIIRGFKYIIDTDKLGVNRFRLFLKLHHLSDAREAELMNYMLNKKEVIQLHKTVGDWDMEVDIESLDKTEMRKLIIELRENFKDLIESFNIIEFYEYYKKTYLPAYIFRPEEAGPESYIEIPHKIFVKKRKAK